MKTQACSTVVGEAKCDYLTSVQQSAAVFLQEYFIILLHDCDHMIITCLGTIVSGHNRVWAQSYLGTIVSGHNRVWAQSCLGTIVWAEVCMGTIVWSP